ncbi:hypothetical protein AN639_01135 [Candidatus Epulonipiscium fishelsonii]|uniref:Uncharacterized protein n=1 Tax=Candidatus Epulonipiscium fishelsonii TaxID=77094 RepID=A0ACC8X7K9_9FIRM|nr:hypothetical protein AN396_12110 [Epulopiscium sp. SCG-B11WGA-EpuloA1]ONI40712.1 hypothetical protein AN639_01135 [Epulopiscium sp. SCG-B05WGA-EpuloA1]
MTKKFSIICMCISIALIGMVLDIIKFEKVFSNTDSIENVILDYVPNLKSFDDLDKIISQKETMLLTSYGSEQLNLFITNFYDDYYSAILYSDYGYIIEYISETSSLDIYNDFNNWFVKNKNIEDINIEIALGKITFNQNNNLVLDITETIFLDNKKDDNLTKFKIYLNWQTEIDIDDYKIEDRTLTESLVSYSKDNEWVIY